TATPEGELSDRDRELFLQAVGDPPQAKAVVRADTGAFLDAVGDATPLPADPRGQIQPSLPPDNAQHIPRYDEDAEALTELEMLVDGVIHFDIADSDEFIAGIAEGVDRRLLGKLRRGEFAVQAHLDLHGMRRDDARRAVAHFIDQKYRAGHRCIRIVHGRGLNSKDKVPVLKMLLSGWLERGRIGRLVLAFCTARPSDGGAGAVYVLLRR
ncbi:MAG: Smr/MutS family protein, partial [Myxococcota bacterium]